MLYSLLTQTLKKLTLFSILLLISTSSAICYVPPRIPAETQETQISAIKTPMAFIPPNYSKRNKARGSRPVAVTPAPLVPVKRAMSPTLSGMTVIIDPGHGGEDEGAKSLGKPVYCEKNFNLVAARLLQSHLEQMGIQTKMTREKDVFISLDARAQIPTRRENEIFVSVHFNAAQSLDAEGIEVFYYDTKNNASRTAKSKALATAVFNQVIAATEAKSRGVKHGNYHVIRENVVPAILIEGGFVTNSDELEKIKNPAYLKKLTWGAAQGIANYINAAKNG